MNFSRRDYLLGSAAMAFAVQSAGARSLNNPKALIPPVAERRPYSYSRHGYTIDDPYHWLKDEGYPKVDDKDVLAYLTAENDYFAQMMQPHQALVETLFQEMKGRLKEDDASVPQKDGDWLYWWDYRPGAQYKRWLRKPAVGGPDQVILNETSEAEGKEYFRLGMLEVSPDGRLLAYSTDDSGAERYTIRFRNLADGKALADAITGASGKWGTESIEGTIGNVVFSADGSCIFYGLTDENWRTRTIKMHRIGTNSSEDKIVYYEEDPMFSVGVARTSDRRWITIVSGNHDTSEVYLIPIDRPAEAPLLVSKRIEGRQYSVDSAHGRLWVITNDDHVNFRLAEAAPDKPADWKTVIAGSDRVYLRGITAFRDHLLITERVDGLDQIRLRDYTGQEHRIAFPEASYTASLGSNPEYTQDQYRLGYSSMVTPNTVYDYDWKKRELIVRKVQEVPSGYDASNYVTERLLVPARDGKQVPVSVVYRKDFVKNGEGRLMLYAYGAYGYAYPPSFSTIRLSLLDRGYAYAIAHIRGGDDLGYDWYLQGKTTKRWNTFHDFVDAAKGLIAAKFTKPGHISINGGSAGGELMGVVTNTDPDLWGAVVADVPFVDVLNTMQDESLPLTPGEWPEWGNPITDKAAFELIRSYSPYDNVEAKPYPPMLITGGLNDPRVTYWEPAKWAAKLRAAKTDDNLILLKINMGAGHGGKSGRYDSLREDAEAYAFILWQMGGA